MNFTVGFVLLGIAAAMLLLARPRNGKPAPFLKLWIVGQVYTVTSLICIAMGITLLVINWP